MRLPRGFEAAQQSVDQGAGLKQLCKGTEAGALGRGCAVARSRCPDSGRRLQVGPLGGNERAALVRQDQQEVQTAVALRPAQKIQGLALERMVGSGDGDRWRKTLEVGSVSWCPSTRSVMIG